MSAISKISNSDTFIKHLNTEGLEKAEVELTRVYGERYTRYRQEWKHAGELAYEPPFPLYIMMEQTYRCNLRCPSCVHGYPDLRKPLSFRESCMPRALWDKVVLEGEKNGCPSISVHNNDEPLLVKDLADRIAFAKAHGFMDIIMTTNGTLFTEEKIRAVIDAGVTRILFSIDAATEEVYDKVRAGGDYNKVICALKQALAYRKEIGSTLPIIRVSFVPTIYNQHQLVEFVKQYKNLVDYIDVQPYCGWKGVNAGVKPLNAAPIQNFRCNGPWRAVIVRGNGDVLPCPNFYGAELVLGNLHDNNLESIFNSKRTRELRREFKEGVYSHAGCHDCSENIFELNL